MPRPKQLEIVGAERPAPRVEGLADRAVSYAEARDARIAAGKVELAEREKLVGIMRGAELAEYRFEWDFGEGDEPVLIELKPTKEKIRVRREKRRQTEEATEVEVEGEES